MQKTKEFESIAAGKTYTFEDLIFDSIPTEYGDMHLVKLVKNDTITQVLKAPKDLRTFLKLNPEVKQFTVKKVIKDGEYLNYVIN